MLMAKNSLMVYENILLALRLRQINIARSARKYAFLYRFLGIKHREIIDDADDSRLERRYGK